MVVLYKKQFFRIFYLIIWKYRPIYYFLFHFLLQLYSSIKQSSEFIEEWYVVHALNGTDLFSYNKEICTHSRWPDLKFTISNHYTHFNATFSNLMRC